jgi:hypothetical protein
MIEKKSKRRRLSSYDKSGGNDDRIYIQAGESKVIANINDCGIINHIWMTHMNEGFKEEKESLRKIIIEMYWDNEENPSVQTPLGDFFGMGHAMSKNFVSEPLQMSPEDGRALNSWWPMPFRKNAKIRIINECDTTLILYYYIDYEIYQSIPEDFLYFHASWNRECPTLGKDYDSFKTNEEFLFEHPNTDGSDNFIILEAKGNGHFCGCHIDIDNFNDREAWDWPGEGDDMIFIDGESWPPNLHGTGTEDYVNMAWCPRQEQSTPYHGLILGGDENWKGKITYYRYHIQDPIPFKKSIKVTIEHGHNNHRSDDWSTTAYWYQAEPHQKFKEILKVNDRLPLKKQ